ncbi:MAG: tetratricopeptide repeat protein [Candidatus Heimdallarchaeota archaeon]|nr:tetratricopeptide repeat protein [Candidatus Heimdallarchaeota archaeon]
MSTLLIREVQDLIDLGELDKALELLKSFPEDLAIESDLYTGLILIAKGKYQLAIDHATKAFDSANITGRALNIQRANIIKAYAWENLGKWDEAYKYILEIQKVLDTFDTESLAAMWYFRTVLYNAKGIVETRIGKRQEAFQTYQDALELVKTMGNKSLIGAIYNNMGHVCIQLGNPKHAFESYQQSLKIANELNNNYQRYYPLSNIGIYYYNKGDMIKSYDFHKRALEMAEIIDNKSNIASEYREISQIHRMNGKLDIALEYLQYSLNLRQEIGNPIWITFNLVYLIDIALEMGDVELAQVYSNDLKKLNSESGSRLINQITRMASGLIYKKSSRLKDKAAAIDIFRRIVEEDIIDYDTTVNSILHLCDLLLFELKLTDEEEVLIEIHFLMAKLIQIAESNNSHTLICEILGLQSNIALIESNLDLAIKLLEEAITIAKEHESFHLETKYNELMEELVKQSEYWNQSIESKNTIAKRMDMSHIEEYLQDIIKIKDNLFQK